MTWRSIAADPPPPGEAVWLTNGRAFCTGTLVRVRRGKAVETQWSYGGFLLHDAEFWCGRKEFEAAAMPPGYREDGVRSDGLCIQPVR